MDNPNVEFQVYYNCFINFEDINFVDDKLAAKTAKFTSLQNLYVYGIAFVTLKTLLFVAQ